MRFTKTVAETVSVWFRVGRNECFIGKLAVAKLMPKFIDSRPSRKDLGGEKKKKETPFNEETCSSAETSSSAFNVFRVGLDRFKYSKARGGFLRAARTNRPCLFLPLLFLPRPPHPPPFRIGPP